MRIRDTQAEDEAPINLMPLIDMVFLLLIFFLVATTFAQEERDMSVQLPGTAEVPSLTAAPQEIIINILADETVTVSGQTYETSRLADLLHRVARDQPDRKVLIRADNASRHGTFARVVRLCHRSGIPKVNIGYILESDAP
jgi:biopolymer transport protein ExbD